MVFCSVLAEMDIQPDNARTKQVCQWTVRRWTGLKRKLSKDDRMFTKTALPDVSLTMSLFFVQHSQGENTISYRCTPANCCVGRMKVSKYNVLN
jgi:hypothetical protein